MGFFGIDHKKKVAEQRKGVTPRGVPVQLLHRDECKACDLNKAKCRSPKMMPAGADDDDQDVLIYVLGEAPNYEADKIDHPLAGLEYDLIRSAVPRRYWKDLRFNNVIRTFPGFGAEVKAFSGEMLDTTKTPSPVQIECCRPSIVRDIERSRPKAIFTFGSVPLRWAANETHPGDWQGRRMPVKIGSHTCWLYPFMHPVDVAKTRKWEGHESETEKTFKLQMFAAVKSTLNEDRPHIDGMEYITRNLLLIDGSGGDADLRKLYRFIDDAIDDGRNGMDYETNALRPYNKEARILTGALAYRDHAMAVAFTHSQNRWTEAQRGKVYDAWGDYVKHRRPRKIAHQLPFEMEWTCFHWGKELAWGSKWGDSLSQAYVLDETQGMLSLEVLTQQRFGFNLKNISDVDRKRLDHEPLPTVLKYNALDARYHLDLFDVQEELLLNDFDSRDRCLMDVYDHQIRRIPSLVLTTMHGVPIDQTRVSTVRDDFEQQLAKIEKELKNDDYVRKFAAKYDHEFNPASPYDVQKYLRDIGHANTKTDEATLTAVDDPLARLLMKWRKPAKVQSTYVLAVTEAYLDRHGAHQPRSPNIYDDGLAHPIISTTKVKTSRTSSEEPNIQNWPKRNENKFVRRLVKAPRGYKVVAFDYAGMQARNVAMESGDRRLVQAFWDHYDIHDDFLDRMIKTYPGLITEGVRMLEDKDKGKKLRKNYRHIAKNKFVFPTFFGAQAKRVATDCGVPIEVGEDWQAEFFGLFPEIKDWQLETQDHYFKHGYVTGLSGYRRRAPVAWNELINAPIQADEAFIAMEAMNALSEYDFERYQPMFMIHDDLTFLWPEKKVDQYADVVISEMTRKRHDWINVPLVVEMLIGDDWDELVEVGDFEGGIKWDGSYKQIADKTKEKRGWTGNGI